MRHLSFINNGKKYDQITKREALKHFIAGEAVIICPANLRPFSMWHPEFEFCKNDHPEETPENYFNLSVMYFTVYNCINSETGKYPVFYMEVKA